MIAILSDIHANAVAFEAVLADMESLQVSVALCLGDTIGYGPEPLRCVQLVQERCVASVLGNHEAFFLLGDAIQGFGDTVSAPIQLAINQLGSEQAAWIRALPIAIDLDAFEVVHASHFEPPAFHYVKTPEDADRNFRNQKHAVSFHGHTHVPAIWEKSETGRIRCYSPEANKALRLDANRTYCINVGSVGQPRDGDPRASYAAYDHSTGLLIHRRVAYDLEKARRAFRGKGIPKANQERLKKGQ